MHPSLLHSSTFAPIPFSFWMQEGRQGGAKDRVRGRHCQSSIEGPGKRNCTNINRWFQPERWTWFKPWENTSAHGWSALINFIDFSKDWMIPGKFRWYSSNLLAVSVSEMLSGLIRFRRTHSSLGQSKVVWYTSRDTKVPLDEKIREFQICCSIFPAYIPHSLTKNMTAHCTSSVTIHSFAKVPLNQHCVWSVEHH